MSNLFQVLKGNTFTTLLILFLINLFEKKNLHEGDVGEADVGM